jgi:hypothetical protein
VILDRPEHIVLVFVPANDAPPRQLGFAARPEGWALQLAAPALALPSLEGQTEVLPELADEPAPEVWREAWRGWWMGRGLPAAEADACEVRVLEDRIRVAASKSVVARVGTERNDAWLLAGAGRVRVAAPLGIVEEE